MLPGHVAERRWHPATPLEMCAVVFTLGYVQGLSLPLEKPAFLNATPSK